jgi:hypothetical protein
VAGVKSMEKETEPKTVAELFDARFPNEIFVIRYATNSPFDGGVRNWLFNYVVCLTPDDCLEFMRNNPHTDITICRPVQKVKIVRDVKVEKV